MSSNPNPRRNPASPRRDSERRERRTSNSARPSSGSRPRRRSTAAEEPPRSGETRRQRRGSSTGQRRDREEQPRTPDRRRRSSAHRGSSARRDGLPERPRAMDTEVYTRPVASSPMSPRHNVRDKMLEANSPGQRVDVSRTKSLVRPERRRHEPGDTDYFYSRHAQNMNVMPSTTGRDPQLEEDYTTASSDSATLKDGSTVEVSPQNEKTLARTATSRTRRSTKREETRLTRKATNTARAQEIKDEQRRQKMRDTGSAPTLWGVYCHIITFWCPNAVLACFGKRQKEQQRAWREKIGLISIILLIMLFVGFLTFGFTETVCPAGSSVRLRINHVGDGYMIFHGQAYDLTHSEHPLAMGVTAGSNVLWDVSPPGAGKDGSFLFQNVNGACKGLITPTPNSDVPTDSNGNMAWYFPCNLYNQDGFAPVNLTIPNYLGYACHTGYEGRQDFYNLHSTGAVYFTWDDIKNSSRNLIVYSGDVLDLNLLEWFNTTQVSYPSAFDEIRQNPAVKGKDLTLAFSTGPNKQMAECFQDIIKVGSIDTESVGCIASKVVLYISLIFILSIVVIKFVLALMFQWFISRKYAATKTSMPSNNKKRQQQIEEWTDDIYRPPPKMTDPATVGGSDRGSKRSSFLPTTSRFTSPYAIERNMNKNPPPPTTMMTQQSSAKISASMYGQTNRSDGMLPLSHGGKPSVSDSRTSLMDSHRDGGMSQRYSSVLNTETDGSGPQGFIHEAVVPQPPLEWQPFGFPLAHTICLVTAYSEGPAGIRTTLDSIAMTDYPNSHKMMFIICDGLIKGKGETLSTPDACVGMMKEHAVLPDEVKAYSYVAVASGSKRHNMAKIYAGFYDYGDDSIIPPAKQQRVPMIVVVKCGNPSEAKSAKPGNRGKRDSQIVLMSFLQKVMFDERMTELEYEMFNGIWKITGISPDFYETVLMVDADTKVFPDSLTHMVSAMVKDPEIMGLCGETKIANKTQSWVTMIQVFEYFISHHQAKAFESFFGGVTCLPGCFCMYRIKTPKGGQNYWVPILANPDIVEHYSENVVDTLHKKNLLLLGEDRYLSSLMLKTFPRRKQMLIPQAVCKTTVPDQFKVLLSQRRRWINSTVHNLMELVLVRDLCGTFCFSMQFVVFMDLVSTLVLPGAISFTIYIIALGIKAAITHTPAPVIPLVLLALILGLPGVLIVITAHHVSYILWMLIYLLSLPVWNFVLPVYAFWHFDDFSWGDTRKAAGEKRGADKSGHANEGEFDSSKITMKRWGDFEQERRLRAPVWSSSGGGRSNNGGGGGNYQPIDGNAANYSPRLMARPTSTYAGGHHERRGSNLLL